MGKYSGKRDAKDDLKSSSKFYIFCEGEKTEPHYFESKKKSIRSNRVDVVPIGIGRSTLSLIDFILEQHLKERVEGDKYRVVFDADPKTGTKTKGKRKENFDNAVKKAECNGLKVAYSHECFELRYLLHFEEFSSTLGRQEYYKKLTKRFKSIDGSIKKYEDEKGNKKLYDMICKYENIAILRAKRLEETHNRDGNLTPSSREPSTTVYKLVEDLNKLEGC